MNRPNDEDMKQYRWMMNRSEVAKNLRYNIAQADTLNCCRNATELFRIGYSQNEIDSFIIAALSTPMTDY